MKEKKLAAIWDNFWWW